MSLYYYVITYIMSLHVIIQMSILKNHTTKHTHTTFDTRYLHGKRTWWVLCVAPTDTV